MVPCAGRRFRRGGESQLVRWSARWIARALARRPPYVFQNGLLINSEVSVNRIHSHDAREYGPLPTAAGYDVPFVHVNPVEPPVEWQLDFGVTEVQFRLLDVFLRFSTAACPTSNDARAWSNSSVLMTPALGALSSRGLRSPRPVHAAASAALHSASAKSRATWNGSGSISISFSPAFTSALR